MAIEDDVRNYLKGIADTNPSFAKKFNETESRLADHKKKCRNDVFKHAAIAFFLVVLVKILLC